MHSFGGVKFNKEAILGISKILKFVRSVYSYWLGRKRIASPEIGGFRRGKRKGERWKLRRDEKIE